MFRHTPAFIRMVRNQHGVLTVCDVSGLSVVHCASMHIYCHQAAYWWQACNRKY